MSDKIKLYLTGPKVGRTMMLGGKIPAINGVIEIDRSDTKRIAYLRKYYAASTKNPVENKASVTPKAVKSDS